jgi:hypothetical protein
MEWIVVVGADKGIAHAVLDIILEAAADAVGTRVLSGASRPEKCGSMIWNATWTS